MQTVIVDRKGSTLTLQNRGIKIVCPSQRRPQHIPLTMAQRLVIMAAVDLHSSLLTALAEAGVSVLILSPRDHRRTAIITPPYGRDHALRMAQYRAVSDVQLCMRLSCLYSKSGQEGMFTNECADY
ncbi:MAG: CRISPR-associated endonuclease Cas1 [Mariprofundales bacterium]